MYRMHLFAFCIFSRLPFSLLQYRSKTPPLFQFGSKISVELLLLAEAALGAAGLALGAAEAALGAAGLVLGAAGSVLGAVETALAWDAVALLAGY